MKKAQNILIAGFGDIGKRVARKLGASRHYRVKALVRNAGAMPANAKIAKSLGVQLLRGDLSKPRSLQNLTGLADTILHFAPPPGFGETDTHTRNLLAALSNNRCRGHRGQYAAPFPRPGMLPRRIVYISTTGVYGNRGGEWVDETSPVKPESARARRRVDAERCLRKWGRIHAVAITVLRSPGIYAHDRLPFDRLRRQTPVLMQSDDVYTNHIHAEDLAGAVIFALRQPRPKRWRVFNVVDDSQLLMGHYFDQVADALGLTRPPRISRTEAERSITPAMFSFMRESRRIHNMRIKRELRLVLRYPTLANVLSGMSLPAEFEA